MTAKTYFETDIGADGEYSFPLLAGGLLAVVELSGGFDGGTATLGHVSRYGLFVAFRDAAGAAITATGPQAWEVRLPPSGLLAISLAGTTGGMATLRLSATLCPP